MIYEHCGHEDCPTCLKRRCNHHYCVHPVVCLRGGERGTCLGPPFFGAPLKCYTHKFSLLLVKNLSSTHPKADQKYSAFKGPPCRNCNVKVLCFQRAPQLPLKCVSTLLLNFIEGAPKRN